MAPVTPCWRLITPWGEEIDFPTAAELRAYLADDARADDASSSDAFRHHDDVPSDVPTRPALVTPTPNAVGYGWHGSPLLAPFASTRPMLLMTSAGANAGRSAELPAATSSALLLVSNARASDSSSDPLACPDPPSSWSSPVSAQLCLSLLPPSLALGPMKEDGMDPPAEPLTEAHLRKGPSDRAGWVAIGAVLGAGFVTVVSRGALHRAAPPEQALGSAAPSSALAVDVPASVIAPATDLPEPEAPPPPPPVAAADALPTAPAEAPAPPPPPAPAAARPAARPPRPAVVVAQTAPRGTTAKPAPLVATAPADPRRQVSDLAFRTPPWPTKAKVAAPDLDKQSTVALLRLADTLWDHGDKPGARKHYDELLRRAHASSYPKRVLDRAMPF